MKIIFLLFFSSHIIANDFVDFFNKVESLSADFTQTINGQDKSSGILLFQRPNKIKWHTLLPDENILLLNNNQVTIYDIWLQSANIMDYEHNNALVEYFLTQPRDLNTIPKLVANEGVINYYSGNDIVFGFQDGDLIRIITTNNFGNKVVVALTNLKINQYIHQDKFIIEFDDDVDVI